MSKIYLAYFQTLTKYFQKTLIPLLCNKYICYTFVSTKRNTNNNYKNQQL